MLKKIIVIDHEPFSERKMDHYYSKEFEKDNIIFEYWQVNNILNYSKNVHYNYNDKNINVVKFRSFKDFLSSVENQNAKNTLFIIEIWSNFQTRKLFWKLANKNFKWVRINYYLNPDLILENKKIINTSIVSIKNFISKFKNFFFRFYYFINKNIFTPHILFVTGEDKSLVDFRTKIISLDFFDVIEFYQNKDEDALLDYEYIVFIDGMILEHPDYCRNSDVEFLHDRQTFFKKLNTFFSEIEKEMGLPVVIACHPKSNYDCEFEHRLLIKDKTCNLVSNATLVLTHGSLSIDFALLSKKPIIYVNYKSFFDNIPYLKYLSNRIINACSYIGSDYYDLEKFNFHNLNLEIDEVKYKNFLDLYYRKNSKESNYFIVKCNFQKLLNEN